MNRNRFRSKSIDRAQEAIQLLLDSGFSAHQVRKTILKNPALLCIKVDQQLKPKIEFLTQTVGIDPQDLDHVISQQPRFLECSLSKNLIPKFLLLIKFLGSNDKLSKAIKRASLLLLCNVHASKNLEKRLKFMESIGLKEYEIKECLEKDPRVFALSTDKMKKNMKFLTHIAGFRPNIVLKYPCFLSYSVERRMKPRHKVFEYLTEIGGAGDVMFGLPSMLCLSEKGFQERFLSIPIVAKVYEKCKGEAVDLDLL